VAALKKLAESVRRSAKAGTWSSGVKLARAESVLVESSSDDEIVARVRAPGRAVAPSAVLYPGEGEWDCDCGGRLMPCEHIAAAAIYLSQDPEEREQAREAASGAAGSSIAASSAEGETAVAPRPAPRVWGRIIYRLTRIEGGLRVTRAIVSDGRETPLTSTLSAVLSKPAEAASVSPEEVDLRADQLLGPGSRAALPATKLEALLRILTGCARVLFDGRPVAISEGELLPRARVEDRGDDVTLTIEASPAIREVVSAGVALIAEDADSLALQRLGELELTGPFLQHVPQVRTFPPRELGTLAGTVLPDLARRIEIDVRSRRLPRLVRDVAPRLVLDLAHVGESLSVLPTLVYGAPPFARVDDQRVVLLRPEGPVPVRDPGAERALVLKLREELDLLPGRRTTFAGMDAPRFAEKLKRWRGGLTGDATAVVGEPRKLRPRLELATTPAADGGPPHVAFDFRFEVEPGRGAEGRSDGATATVDAEAVVRAWREGLGLVPLLGGGWAALPKAWLAKHGERVADLLAARDGAGRLATHALRDLGPLCDDLDQPRPAGLERLEPLFASFDQLPEPALPADLAATLRPYQRRGVAWLAFLRAARLGGILADDMGLGKTLQALCIAGPGTQVVCPTSVLHNWAAEAARFRPGLKVCVYHGPSRVLDESADLTITSYALLRLDATKLAAKNWRAVFLDEAQAIKNPESQVARAAFALPAELRIAMSGTPVENRLDELWSLMRFANPGLLGGRSDFDARTSRAVALGDRTETERLRTRIRPFILRRLKREVAPDLPPRTEAVLRVELDERERAVYDAVRAASRADVLALMEAGGGVMKVLEALLRLRQAASHAALVPGQAATRSSKVDVLMEALATAAADGHKALVFSQWTGFLDLVEPHLTAAGIAFCRLDGTTRDRAGVTGAFQAEDGPPVMLVSLKAGGSGLNLTAADHVFLCDLWWNPAVEDQAADRAHRIGQERPVTIYRLVTTETVEERILALQAQKRGLVDAALGDPALAAALTKEDLLALLA
jgi:superfamily II DNA or RNA helicase